MMRDSFTVYLKIFWFCNVSTTASIVSINDIELRKLFSVHSLELVG